MPAPAEERVFSASSPLVWGLAIGQLIGWGTLYFAFVLFVQPMEAELGWSRAELNGALTLGLLTSGLGSIPAGAFVDRHGGRWLMTIGSIASGLLLALWSQVETLGAFYLIWFSIGLAIAATVQDLPFAIVTANIKDFRRAINVIAILGGLGSSLFLPLTNWLIGEFGWRHALLILALIQITIPTAFNVVILRGTRGSRSGEGAGEQAEIEDGSPMVAALRRPAFWGLAAAFGTQSLLFTAVSFHLLPLLEEKGISLDRAVIALALIGPAQAVGRILLFIIAARASARTVGRVMMPALPIATALLFAVAPHELWGLALFVVLFGFGNGILTIVRATGIAEILGTRGYGAITGAMNLVLMVPRTIAPLAIAALWEWRRSYDPVIWLLVAATVLGVGAFWAASGARGRVANSE